MTDDALPIALVAGMVVAVIGITATATHGDALRQRDMDVVRCDKSISVSRSEDPADMSRAGRRACLRVWGYR
jgi:hypothetical protein